MSQQLLDRIAAQKVRSPNPRNILSPEPSTILDYARQMQMDAQSFRTVERIRQLTPDEKSSSVGRDSATNNEDAKKEKVTNNGDDDSVNGGGSLFTGVPLRSNMFDANHVPRGPGVVDWRTRG
jgi:hypothetical protein